MTVDTRSLRDLAVRSVDGDLRGAALYAADTIEVQAAEIARLKAALKFYANRGHLLIADEDAWEAPSGEPGNFLCDAAGTATVEDGSNPETIRALLADYDRLREALIWTAAVLNECCKECIREASNITIADETKSFSEILDMADAALEQEQP